MSKYTAIIIEPRKHKAFEFVLKNFLSNLSEEWNFVIFHGIQNEEYVKNIINNLEEQYKKRICNIVNLNVNNLNPGTYSRLFITEIFYSFIPTETFLVFQTDCIIFKENKDIINSFLEYDYVGAPWASNVAGHGGLSLVGNGGLSLRKKSKMLEVIQKQGYNANHYFDINFHEDVYFSFNMFYLKTYNIPDRSLAKQFSIETMFYDAPFGCHNCWNYLNQDEMKILTDKYSELKELINLQ